MPVWNLVEEQSKRTDSASAEKKETYEMYGSVASLYRTHRPRYPDELLTKAIDNSPLLRDNKNAEILEIGCGPGTVTQQLLQRGFCVTAFDPSNEMIEQAKEACQEYSTKANFQISTLADFQSDRQYDAIVAASSLHWALAEPNPDALLKKLSDFLKPNGTFIILWNFPFQPTSEVRDAVADALNKPKPYFFSGGDGTDSHVSQLENKILEPLNECKLFGTIETTRLDIDQELTIHEFFSFLSTLSMYITMPSDEKQRFFQVAEKAILSAQSGSSEKLKTTRTSILNLLKKQ